VNNENYFDNEKYVIANYTDFQYSDIEDGGLIYVEKTGEETYIITFCELHYEMQQFQCVVKGRITVD
jgi:hypothetical protein